MRKKRILFLFMSDSPGFCTFRFYPSVISLFPKVLHLSIKGFNIMV